MWFLKALEYKLRLYLKFCVATSASYVVLLHMGGILGQEKTVSNFFIFSTTFKSDLHFFCDPYISISNLFSHKLLRAIAG